MRQIRHFIIALLFHQAASGQNTNALFQATKGKWTFPISNIQSVDTMMRDCLGRKHSSNYLTLKADYSQPVRAIQAGEVRAVFDVNKVYTVMVKSGDYFLVYTGLDKPALKKNEKILAGMTVGSLTKGDDGEPYELNLMLMKGEKFLNINRWFDWAAVQNSGFLLCWQVEEALAIYR